MKLLFDQRFNIDLKEIRDTDLKREVIAVLDEIKEAEKINDIFEAEFLRNSNKYFRVRVGHYRIGCELTTNKIVWAIRFKHRSEIYKVFP